MDTNKEKIKQRIRKKRGLYERWRRKRWLWFKHTGRTHFYFSRFIKPVVRQKIIEPQVVERKVEVKKLSLWEKIKKICQVKK